MQHGERPPALVQEEHVDKVSRAENADHHAEEARKVPRHEVGPVLVRLRHEAGPYLGSETAQDGPEDHRGPAELVRQRRIQEAPGRETCRRRRILGGRRMIRRGF